VEKLGLNNPEKIWGGLGKIWGACAPPGPNVEPPLGSATARGCGEFKKSGVVVLT